MWKVKCSMFPSNPDDGSPSKSRLVTNYFVDNGTEYTLEIRSAYDGVGTHRMGELVLWKGHDDGAITARAIEQDA